MEERVNESEIDFNTLDFDQICRGCLNDGDVKSIYSNIEDINDVLLGEMFVECTSVLITETDGLPNQLCDHCIFQLTQAYLFKKQCQKIDDSLRYYVEQKFTDLEDKETTTSHYENEIDCNEELEEVENEEEISTVEVLGYETLSNGSHQSCINEENAELKPIDSRNQWEQQNEEENKCKQEKIKRERNFNCDQCSKRFFTASHLRTHSLVHTDEKPYTCHVCLRAFNSKPNLKRHSMMHTGERPFQCHICTKGFIQAVTLKEHLRVHTKETPYSCEDCQRSFKQAGELRRHLKKFHDLPDNNSSQRKIKTESIRQENRRKRHKSMEKIFLCSDCGKAFSSRTLLQIHNRIHTGEKPYSCNSCSKAFSQISTLKTHMLVHTGEKKYDCSVCSKSFRHRIALKQHLLIHMGIKKYGCTFCSKTFTQSSQLSYHLRTHTGEKPYECEVCHKTFALKGNLTVHTRTHTGETPYVCLVCDKGFYDSSSMKKHQKTHGDEINTTLQSNNILIEIKTGEDV